MLIYIDWAFSIYFNVCFSGVCNRLSNIFLARVLKKKNTTQIVSEVIEGTDEQERMRSLQLPV